MSQKLTANKWGFSVENDNPFAVFRYLQKVAASSVGAAGVIDLSRGDPGYGFTPSVRGRRFFSFMIELDSYFNSGDKRFGRDGELDAAGVWAEIKEYVGDVYSANRAEVLIKDMEEFVARVKSASARFGLGWKDEDVFMNIFGYCAVSGGSYLNPQGEEITRVVLADWYAQFIESDIGFEDLILCNGASHAIGTVFKTFGAEGLGVLKEGSTVAICSPSYSPYYSSLINRNIDTLNIAMNPLTGELVERDLELVYQSEKNIDAIILIDPNNPTGFSLDGKSLERIADIARQHDAVIITDEVYCSFFPRKKTVIDYCPERTVRIDARSKVERSTGLRFGDILILKEFNARGLKYNELKSAFMSAKGPGGTHGEFQHTTFVPGPSQFLGISHIVLGDAEREEYFVSVKNNGEVFCEELGLSKMGNLYYLIFDMNAVGGCTKGDIPVEQKLIDLAKKGVIYLPVYLFFPEKERSKNASVNMVRVSVVNTSLENVKKAAEITKSYLTS